MANDMIYDFTTPESSHSMNPIGLTFNFYNKSMFKELGEEDPGTEGPLHAPADKNMNYAAIDAPYHSGGIAGKMEATAINDVPFKKKVIKRQDMYDFLQGKLHDMHRTLFDPGMDGINSSGSNDQKFESTGYGPNSGTSGNNNPLAYHISMTNIDNPQEYDMGKPEKSYTGFLKKHYSKLVESLKAEHNKTVTLKADTQVKPTPNPDYTSDVSVASQYAWSKNGAGTGGDSY